MIEDQSKELQTLNVKSNYRLEFRTVKGLGEELTLCVDALPTYDGITLSYRALITAALRNESHKAKRFITRLSLPRVIYAHTCGGSELKASWLDLTGVELEVVEGDFHEQLLLVVQAANREGVCKNAYSDLEEPELDCSCRSCTLATFHPSGKSNMPCEKGVEHCKV